MRKWFVFVAALLAWGTFTACNKEPGPLAGVDPVGQQQGEATLNAFFDKHQIQKEHFQLNATDGAVLTTRNGTRITIARNAFLLQGNPVDGEINVWVHDVLYVSNMLLADNPTLTADGNTLESYGQIIITAEQGGEVLQLAADAATTGAVSVRFPIGVPQGQGQIPVWTGDTTDLISNQGYNSENTPTTVGTPLTLQRGIAWRNMPGVFSEANTLSNTFNLSALNQWHCAGKMYDDGRTKTTVLGYLGSRYNSLTGNASIARGPSLLFFKYRSTNTLVKFYQPILNPAPGKEGLMSYQNKLPLGQEGTFLAISALGDKLYAETRDLVLPESTSGRSFIGISFKLVEVTEPQLLALVQQLNKK